MSSPLLIVSQALIPGQDGVTLHPELLLWDKQFSAYKQQWFHCSDKNPLGWYAACCDISPAALLAEKCAFLPDHTSQCWVASPYHAQLLRETVRVYPEGMFPWNEQDALHLCDTLNPLLADEGMQLHAVGAALLLTCREPMDAFPQGFGELSGKQLPDRHHEGEDGGRLNRLLSEIQMLLFQHPCEARHDRGEVDVNGIWLWAPTDGSTVETGRRQITVATRNPVLQSIVNGKDAGLIITEVERMTELLKQDVPLPKRIVLAGEGHAVILTKSLLPKFGKAAWKLKSPRREDELLSTLRAAGRLLVKI